MNYKIINLYLEDMITRFMKERRVLYDPFYFIDRHRKEIDKDTEELMFKLCANVGELSNALLSKK